MGIYSQALQGMGRTAHPPRKRQWYGMASTAHEAPSRGKRATYGVTFPMRGAWGDFGRSVLGDIVQTGKDIWISRNTPGGSSQQPLVVYMPPQPAADGGSDLMATARKVAPWALLAALAFFFLRKGR